MKYFVRLCLKIFGAIFLFIVLYFIAAFGLSSITTNSDFKPCDKNAIEIYIKSNGVHTDLVMPFRSKIKDWSAFVNPADTKQGDTDPGYVSFGWGDKGFYLDTPTWSELKFSIAFKALFFLSTTAMHVSFYNEINENEFCRKVCIDTTSYSRMVNYVENSFVINGEKPKLIKGASYGNNDLFYDAKGTYNLFYTCNTWANGGLKAANLKACLWTPFDKGILNKYK
ncbi:MAG TPA: TIGR02117 family protein [Bacteroidia bacterium]